MATRTTKSTKAARTPSVKALPATTTAAATALAAPAFAAALSPDAVAARAYALWRESGCAPGQDLAHWLRAEQELRGQVR